MEIPSSPTFFFSVTFPKAQSLASPALIHLAFVFVFGEQEELLGGWKIKRIVDGQEKPEYQLPRDFTLGPGKKVKVSRTGRLSRSAL